MNGVAIIGIGCRLPGGIESPGDYWRLLCAGRSAVTEIPPGRWSLEGFYDPKPDMPTRSYSKWGGFLRDIRGFDPEFFGLSPGEAEAMDPQQRLLLEVAYEALQDSGRPISAYRDATAGVFIGVSNTEYGVLQRYRDGVGDRHAGTGTVLSIVANRLSYAFDLKGPSLAVDTACSSSLVAVDTACRHLQSGSCGLAFAGGVNLLLDPRLFLTFCRAHMLSPAGRIRAFDARADGFVRGEGAGIVILKPEADALSDGDRIYAVIRATAVNQDGNTGTLTAPSKTAQSAMMRDAVRMSGIDPCDLSFVEAHGTGTPVGDPIEAAAIGEVFGGGRDRPLLIGSAKTNIGHLEPAAGIAGLVKAALALHRGKLPPSLGYDTASPGIDLDALNLKVVTKLSALASPRADNFGLVNSFGFGGTNACALLQGPSDAAAGTDRISQTGSFRTKPEVGQIAVPVPLSAPTETHLQADARRIADALDAGGSLASRPLSEIAAALAGRRDHFAHRAVVFAKTVADLRTRLRCLADGREWPRTDKKDLPQIIKGQAKKGRRLVFTTTGQGGQWWAMGRRLLEANPRFRKFVAEFDAIFSPGAGWSVIEVLSATESGSNIDDPAITPAVMFALQAGLAEIWKSLGVEPEVVIGHSFGEVTAAYLAGAITADHVARLVRHRGLIRGHVDRKGVMAAIGLGPDEVEKLLPNDGSIEIGGYNAPNQVTLTGEEAPIDALIARLHERDENILARKLALDFAYHSSWFEPVEHVFKSQVGRLDSRSPAIPVISTVTGRPQDKFDADYWWRNLRQPVLYEQAVNHALDTGVDSFVELGPHRTLSSMTAACAAAKGIEVVTVSTLHRQWDDFESINCAAAQLYTCGVDIDWSVALGKPPKDLALPQIPWMRRTLWMAPEEADRKLFTAGDHPLLGRRESAPLPSWTNEISLASHSYLGEHRINGACVFPAACMIEMLRAAAHDVLGADAAELLDLEFAEALYLDVETELLLRTTYNESRQMLMVHGRRRGGPESWALHARVRALPYDAKIKDSVRKDCASEIDIEQFYAVAQARGYEYGPSFRGLKRIARNGAVLFGEAELPATVAHEAQNAGLDPRLLDACLQLMIGSFPAMGKAGETADGPSQVYVPVRMGRVIISGFPKGRAAVRAKATYSRDQNEIQADFLIGDVGAEASIRIDGLVARPISLGRPSCSSEPGQPAFYTEVFEPAPLSDVKANGVGAAMPGRWLIISLRDSRIASAIRGSLMAFGEDAACIRLDKKASVKEDAYRSALADALSDHPAKAIIYALPLDSDASLPFGDVPSALGDHALRLTAFGRALAACPVADDCSLVWIVTRHARSIGPADSPPASGLAQSGLIGLARAIAVECPEHELRLLDVDMPACLETNRIAAAITKGWRESEILIRGEKVFVPRLRQRQRDDLPPRIVPLRRLPPNQNFVLCRSGPIGPGSLAWREQSQSNLRRNHVRVEVRAAGLNFRDVMAVGGLLPEDAEDGRPLDALGLEFAGVVRETGPDVADLQTGERVFGMARGSLRRFLDVPADRLHAIPATLTDEAAAALPSAYLTAHYALNTLARISANDRVLIHNASGGVGLAAMALAKLAGAEIFATAGTDAKRSFLRQQGIRHVMDSRSLAFADEVMDLTDGAGVDVVFNSLPGPYMEKGLTCLAPYGRFLELGKRDIYADSALGLRALRSNISFHVIDVAALIEERPQSVRLLMRELLTLIEDGRLEPLPVISFTAGEIADAFRYFAGARQIGKIAVSFGDPELPIRRNLSAGAGLDRNGCYLVTGGTAGFGFEVGLWLAGRGAGYVVLASRTGAVSPENAERVEELVATGAKIEFASLDVADFGQVRLFIDRLAGSGKTLRGVIHAAAVYDDALLPDITAEKFDRVLAPKVRGSVNLTRAIKDSRCCLDFFVSFSSLAQVVGWTGQASYAAANSFLRALVDWQRLQGIPGQCINWGVFREAGHVARNGKMISYMNNAGWVALDNDQALAALAVALEIDSAELTYGAADWMRLAANHKPLRTTVRLSELLAKGEHRSKASMQRLNRSNGESQLAEAEQVVRAQAGKVLRIDVDTLRSCQTLDEAGLDSLSTFELKSRIESELGLIVPFGRYTKAASFDELAELVCDLVNEARK